jgi:hypothetical protein
VAFSVPIWPEPKSAEDASGAATGGDQSLDAGEASADGNEPIGVLAMSVNAHDFKVLDKAYAGGSDVVLIDMRSDWIEEQDGHATEGHGLILHHPNLEKGKLARADTKLLEQINAAEPLTSSDFDGADHFLVGYADPLSKEATNQYWGAFEPVRFDPSNLDPSQEPTDLVGWVVLVQKPMQ